MSSTSFRFVPSILLQRIATAMVLAPLVLAAVACDSGSKDAANTSNDKTETKDSGDDSKDETSKSGDETPTDATTTTQETNTDGSTGTGTGTVADGGDCDSDEQCVSGICHDIFQICGQCNGDAQCKEEGKLNCSLDDSVGTKCSDGALGERCESNEACADMRCYLRTIPGSDKKIGTCSECLDAQSCVDDGKGINCARPIDGKWYVCTAGELGERCKEDKQCAGEICHATNGPGGSMSGVCSECRDDKSCTDASKGLNCTSKLSLEGSDPMKDANYYTCGDGSVGQSCEAEAACKEELACALPEMGPGTCSKCATTADCKDEKKVCSLVADEMSFRGALDCVEIGTQANNSMCTPQEDPEKDACEKFCVKIETMFSSNLGACGECRPDHAEEDCGAGKTCEAPMFSMGGLIGSVCK